MKMKRTVLNSTLATLFLLGSVGAQAQANDSVAPLDGVISDAGVDSSVLATTFLQNTHAESNAGSGGVNMPSLIYTAFRAVPMTGTVPGGQVDEASTLPPVAGYQDRRFVDEAAGTSIFSITSRLGVSQNEVGGDYRYPETKADVSVTLDAANIHVKPGAKQASFKTIAKSHPKPLLTLDDKVEIQDKDAQGESHTTVLTNNDGPFAVPSQMKIPFYQPLRRWTGEGGAFAELMVLRGDTPDNFRVCLNAHTANTKRLVCSMWSVSQQWTLDAPDELKYRGIYVVDDRSVFTGETGTKVWQTRLDAPAAAPAAAQP